MGSDNIPELTLASGAANQRIPVLGFGTAAFPFAGSETTKEAIVEAIKLGYRHFDTAFPYNTEQILGQAISEALSLGLIQSRAQLFITSKLWCGDAHHNRVVPAIQNTLKNLAVDYIDLYLIHWPVAVTPGKGVPFSKEDILPLDFKSVWERMEECQRLGLTKAIGVSNFSCKKIEILLSTARIPPAVNQVEMHPFWQQKKLKAFCEKKGIVITAFSPLGGKGTPWGTNKVMESEVLRDIAEAKGKTIAQVCLRWAYEQGITFVMKSFNKDRMKENLGIFDWSLSPDELRKIEQIPQQKSYDGQLFIAEEGPYKSSIEELWDGEI